MAIIVFAGLGLSLLAVMTMVSTRLGLSLDIVIIAPTRCRVRWGMRVEAAMRIFVTWSIYCGRLLVLKNRSWLKREIRARRDEKKPREIGRRRASSVFE